MTEATLPANPGSFHAEPQARSWLSQVVSDTVRRRGAMMGMIWISVVAASAIFAPFLANSYPIAVKIGDKWSSPLLRHLDWADVTLLVSFFAGAALFTLCRGWSILLKIAVLLGIIVATIAITFLTLTPIRTNIFEEYREAQATGKIESVLHVPLPFSPSDHLRDQFDPDRPHPWAPSRAHPLGTETNGEDILAIMIHACRIAMAIGFISTGISLVIGVIIGSQMGYFSGIVDLIGMRWVEVFGAIPQIYLLLAFCAVFERNIYMVMAIIGLTSWTGDARFVRAEFLRLRNQDFVQASIAAGLPLRSVLFRHILPNALAPLLVSASFGVASAILSESVLSFLGLGLPVDAASWGRLLNQAVGSGEGFHWWLATYPGLAIFLTVFSYNLIGEALRDALDPRLLKT
jgi:peptide/nickel transport system permease protein